MCFFYRSPLPSAFHHMPKFLHSFYVYPQTPQHLNLAFLQVLYFYAQNPFFRLIFRMYSLIFLFFTYAIQPFLTQGVDVQPSGNIYFRNPSFEDTPRSSASPDGWTSSAGSTPDILPGPWEVKCVPQDGKSCVGLVTREDGTREDISQALSETLKKGNCYAFSLFLSHAPKYAGYNQPVRIRVWGGSAKGSKEELLDMSPMIEHAEWRNYKIQFVAGRDIRFVTFEAYYAPGVTFKYKGNILLDACSAIEKCSRA
jgi:hypothetical protein